MTFQTSSYHRHAHKSIDEQKVSTWAMNDTVDKWRHKRMYDTLLPLIKSNTDADWLTVGDGRYGTDAHYLGEHGVSALPTDISETYLKPAKESGYIKDYSIQNAESLKFKDSSFDFVLCKEAYHHFPRPMIAVYEMLRVARTGIVLIEPNDHTLINPRFRLRAALGYLWQSLKNEFKLFAGKPIYYHHGNYEPDGNYVFTISEREIEKVALGINLPAVAFKGMDDHYVTGVEYEKLNENGPLFKEVDSKIKRTEALSVKGLKNFGLLVAIIFKELPSAETVDSLRKEGFRVDLLPRNPFA